MSFLLDAEPAVSRLLVVRSLHLMFQLRKAGDAHHCQCGTRRDPKERVPSPFTLYRDGS